MRSSTKRSISKRIEKRSSRKKRSSKSKKRISISKRIGKRSSKKLSSKKRRKSKLGGGFRDGYTFQGDEACVFYPSLLEGSLEYVTKVFTKNTDFEKSFEKDLYS